MQASLMTCLRARVADTNIELSSLGGTGGPTSPRLPLMRLAAAPYLLPSKKNLVPHACTSSSPQSTRTSQSARGNWETTALASMYPPFTLSLAFRLKPILSIGVAGHRVRALTVKMGKWEILPIFSILRG